MKLKSGSIKMSDDELRASQLLFDNQVLTVPEAAAILRISVRTVRKRIANGTIPHKRIGKCIRFSRNELLAWVERGE